MKTHVVLCIVATVTFLTAGMVLAQGAGPPGPQESRPALENERGFNRGPGGPGGPGGPPGQFNRRANYRGGPPGPPMHMRGGHGGKHGRGGMRGLMQALDLTDEQRKAVRELMLSHRKETQKARIGLMTIRDEQKTMLMSGNIDLNKLADLDEQSVKLKSEIMRSKLKMKRERLKLLTPEQQEKLGDLMMNTRSRGGFGGPGRMRGGQRADAFIPGGLDSAEDI